MAERNNKGKEEIEMVEGGGLLYRAGKMLKLVRWKRGRLKGVYREVDAQEYDARIQSIADMIAKCSMVDLAVVLKDALYDLPLDLLDKVEGKLGQEIEKAKVEKREPRVATKTRERGTCVNLNINGDFALNLRQ